MNSFINPKTLGWDITEIPNTDNIIRDHVLDVIVVINRLPELNPVTKHYFDAAIGLFEYPWATGVSMQRNMCSICGLEVSETSYGYRGANRVCYKCVKIIKTIKVERVQKLICAEYDGLMRIADITYMKYCDRINLGHYKCILNTDKKETGCCIFCLQDKCDRICVECADIVMRIITDKYIFGYWVLKSIDSDLLSRDVRDVILTLMLVD